MKACNKLECLILADLSNLVGQVPTQVEHLSVAPLLRKLTQNIRLGWEGLPEANTQAYYEIRKNSYNIGR